MGAVTEPEKGKPPATISGIVGTAFREATERRLMELVRSEPVPRHLAIIMDGNRRFAAARELLVAQGHEKGKDKLEDLLNWCLEIDIKVLTVFALSTENLGRPADEVSALMDLFERSFREVVTDPRVHRHHIRVRAFGRREMLPQRVRDAIDAAEAATRHYDRYSYNIAIAYGGRDEIVRAIRTLAEEVREGRLDPQQIDAGLVSAHLYTADLPDPDLIFRTSGEERISNFLLWQSAYSELYFSDVLWPGLTHLDFLRAIRAFQQRQRRFGE
jgi:tritrans,polycis-undecaprenyl-diphosphate synthase [geranylgeranyl-diphosphate specific]